MAGRGKDAAEPAAASGGGRGPMIGEAAERGACGQVGQGGDSRGSWRPKSQAKTASSVKQAHEWGGALDETGEAGGSPRGRQAAAARLRGAKQSPTLL